MGNASLYGSVALGVLGLYALKVVVTNRKRLAPLPPGPKGLPVIGNATAMPPAGTREWEHWIKHKELYGPISSITIVGQTLVIISDVQIAIDLMEKRSVVHSGRGHTIFAGEMVGWENALIFQQNSKRFREERKHLHRLLGTKAAASEFNSLQKVEVGRFLLRLLEKPEGLLQHIRTEAGAVILKITYGYTVKSHERDPLVDLVEESIEDLSHSAIMPVDIFPFLRYIPSFLPGGGFKRTAERMRRNLINLVEVPYEFVTQRMTQGKYQPSYLSKLLEHSNMKPSPDEQYLAKWSSASLYGAGADTTVSSLSCFFLAMVLFPEVQKKAQEEIDRVVGKERLPDFDDRDKLPYINAIVKEVLRWHPVTPLGIPHMTTEDDIYEGYLIPKGAYLFPNNWAFGHDPKTYHDPMTFKPERFLEIDGNTPERDPNTFAFGFGRRICPGRELASNSIYLTIVQALAVFSLGKPVGDDGKEVDLVAEFQPGVVSHPVPYKLTVKPRSPEHEALLRAFEAEYPWEESDASFLPAFKH